MFRPPSRGPIAARSVSVVPFDSTQKDVLRIYASDRLRSQGPTANRPAPQCLPILRCSPIWAIILDMIGYVKFRVEDDKNRRSYHCAYCGAFITDSAAMITIQGARDHSFVNPAGVLCNFTTFVTCQNVTAHQELYVQHSWFPGYGWRFLLCARCFQHIGWKYDAVREGLRPPSFFGILVESVDSVSPDSSSRR